MGECAVLTFPNIFGNKPACAAAIGMAPCIRIQPLSAPMVAMTAPAATIYLAPPPQKISATSAKGALDSASISDGMTPMMDTELMM